MTKMQVHYLKNLHVKCSHGMGAEIETDAPKDNGGEGKLFSPTDLLAASLGSCMLTVMAIAAKKLGVAFSDVNAEVEKEMSSDLPRRISKITVRIRSSIAPEESVRSNLEHAAKDCPVHHSLHPSVKLNLSFHWGI